MHIDDVARGIWSGLVPEYEAELRAFLDTQDRQWLVDQLVRLTLAPDLRAERDRRVQRSASAESRAQRLARLRTIDLDESALTDFLATHDGRDREGLIRDGLLSAAAPEPGTDLIVAADRTEAGEVLLTLAKDLLFALLFGDEDTDTRLPRVRRELLTMVLPRAKAGAIDFLQATTQTDALGTWQDPESVSHDAAADNVVLEVEFGEVAGEVVSDGVKLALGLINHLEVNEQILYARIEDIEDSTLVD